MAGIATYTIAGRQIGGHYFAMGVLGTLFGGVYLATSGPKKAAAATNTPPINASSPDEEDFISKWIKENSNEEKKH